MTVWSDGIEIVVLNLNANAHAAGQAKRSKSAFTHLVLTAPRRAEPAP